MQRYDARHDLLVQLVVQPVFLRFPQEDFAGTQLIVVAIQIQREQKVPDVVLRTEQPFWQQNSVQLYELVVGEPHVKTGLSDPHCLQHSGVPQLSLHGLVIKLIGHFVTIRLDAAYEEGVRLVQGVHERVEGLLELRRHRHGLFAGLPQLSLVRCCYPSATRKSLHRLQVLQALFAALTRTKRLVFPAWKRPIRERVGFNGESGKRKSNTSKTHMLQNKLHGKHEHQSYTAHGDILKNKNNDNN